MRLWCSLLFIYGIPAITAVGLAFSANNHKLLQTLLISLGAGTIGTVFSLLTLGLAILTLGGTREDGCPAKKALYTGWALSLLVGLIISPCPHIWNFPIWADRVLTWTGSFIVGFGLSFLLAFMLDTLKKLRKLE